MSRKQRPRASGTVNCARYAFESYFDLKCRDFNVLEYRISLTRGRCGLKGTLTSVICKKKQERKQRMDNSSPLSKIPATLVAAQ